MENDNAKNADIETGMVLAQPGGVLEIPADLPRDGAEVNEQFESRELKLPMLRICQSGTPQRKRQNDAFIPGLNEGDFFNDLTRQNYGTGPLKAVKLKFWSNAIKFKPIDQGGGIICRDSKSGGTCPYPCPKAQTWADGQKPECTEFFNYLLYLPDTDEVVWFSGKSTFLKPMKLLNSYLRLPRLIPIGDYAKIFEMRSVPDPKSTDAQTWNVPKFSQVIGFMQGEKALKLRDLAVGYKDVVIDTSRAETLDEETGDYSRPPVEQKNDDIPF